MTSVGETYQADKPQIGIEEENRNGVKDRLGAALLGTLAVVSPGCLELS
jgi:hypothetical protein